jgi:hypothetical protein
MTSKLILTTQNYWVPSLERNEWPTERQKVLNYSNVLSF